MTRRMIFDFIKTDVYTQIPLGTPGISDIKEIAKEVVRYRRENGYPVEMNAKVDDGVLYINGDALCRISAKYIRPPFSDGAYYWEGRILASHGL